MNKCYFFIIFLLFAQLSLAKERILIVTEQWPPYNYTNHEGEIIGSSTKIIQAVMAQTDLDYEIKLYSWSKAYQLAKNNPNVLIYTIYRIKERESSFQWICPLNGTQSLNIYALKTSKNIEVNTLEDAKNYLIGAVNQDVTFQYLINNNFELGKHLDIATDEYANVRKLLRGRVDLIIQEEEALKFRLKRENVAFNEVIKVFTLFDKSLNNNCMAMSITTSKSIINKISKALKSINQH
jgi:polar amino acid transport system substrate-binding protein